MQITLLKPTKEERKKHPYLQNDESIQLTGILESLMASELMDLLRLRENSIIYDDLKKLFGHTNMGKLFVLNQATMIAERNGFITEREALTYWEWDNVKRGICEE